MKTALAAIALALLGGAAASAQSLPPVPRVLLDTAAVVCVKVAGDGQVDGAFLVTSTGRRDGDRELLGWVRQMRWNAASGNEGEHAPEGRWFPMPVAFGDAETPPPPATCGPQGGASGIIA